MGLPAINSTGLHGSFHGISHGMRWHPSRSLQDPSHTLSPRDSVISDQTRIAWRRCFSRFSRSSLELPRYPGRLTLLLPRVSPSLLEIPHTGFFARPALTTIDVLPFPSPMGSRMEIPWYSHGIAGVSVEDSHKILQDLTWDAMGSCGGFPRGIPRHPAVSRGVSYGNLCFEA